MSSSGQAACRGNAAVTAHCAARDLLLDDDTTFGFGNNSGYAAIFLRQPDMENELESWVFTAADGKITVSVVPANGSRLTIPARTLPPPLERDNRINALKVEQQALAEAA